MLLNYFISSEENHDVKTVNTENQTREGVTG